MKLRTVKNLYYLLFLAAVIVVVAGYGWPLPVYMAAGLGVLAVMMFVLQRYWRCPLCGKQLGRMIIGAEVECPQCKKMLKI